MSLDSFALVCCLPINRIALMLRALLGTCVVTVYSDYVLKLCPSLEVWKSGYPNYTKTIKQIKQILYYKYFVWNHK